MRSSNEPRGASGQILALFALSLVAIVAMAALLFDGSQALVTRRSLQNAGDAAALAGANLLQTTPTPGCSVISTPPGPPRPDVTAAVLASVNSNLPDLPVANVTVTCPPEWENQAVRVELVGAASQFFSGSVIGGPFRVATRSTAINGRKIGTYFSVVLLDPHNPSWPSGRRGCPSFLLAGGPAVQFDGSIQVNSSCPASAGGALATNGNAATMSVATGQRISLVGGYSPAALTINPVPLTGQKSIADPLAQLPEVPLVSLPIQSPALGKLILNNETRVLKPGIYLGGIELRNSSKAYLEPGIYVLAGGGLSLGAQSEFYSVNPGVTSVTSDTWAQNCGNTTCGVLMYNTQVVPGTISDPLNLGAVMGPISASAGAVVKLKAYDDRALTGGVRDYRNVLIFQSRSPAPTSTYAQPTISLNGGGSVDISGSVYAPNALVQMGGTSGGSGGGNVNLTLQFIAWNLQIQGNVAFRFFYSADDFAYVTSYGLVE